MQAQPGPWRNAILRELAALTEHVYFPRVVYQFKKHFRLDEAREMLPRLRQTFGTIHAARDALIAAEGKLFARLEKTGGDCGGAQVGALIRSMMSIHEGLSDISGHGIQIKDVDRGLVDFPHLREGREVFLCWELEEDDIEFWHDIDTGYPGREKI